MRKLFDMDLLVRFGGLEDGRVSFLAIKVVYRLAFREEAGKEQAPKGHTGRSQWLVTLAMNLIQ